MLHQDPFGCYIIYFEADFRYVDDLIMPVRKLCTTKWVCGFPYNKCQLMHIVHLYTEEHYFNRTQNHRSHIYETNDVHIAILIMHLQTILIVYYKTPSLFTTLFFIYVKNKQSKVRLYSWTIKMYDTFVLPGNGSFFDKQKHHQHLKSWILCLHLLCSVVQGWNQSLHCNK